MSVYRECSKVARELLRSDEPFTDLDIIQRAQSPDWTEKEHKKALHDAAQIAAAFYRAGNLVRFGPVEYGPERDYARGAEGHLLYRAATPPSRPLKTPNGTFDEVFYADDPLYKNGRRKGTTRNDLEPWSAQSPVPSIESGARSSADRENAKLKADLASAHDRIDALETELDRLRERMMAHGGEAISAA